MELVIAVIENPDYVRPIITKFYEGGIPGATVIDGRGMGHMMADKTSIFSRFSDLTGGDGAINHNNIIFTVVEDEKVDKAFEIIEEEIGNLEEPDTGLVLSVPVNKISGFGTLLE